MVFLNFFLSVFSEKLEIKAMNTPYITIGGKKLKVGDKFDSREKITWSSDNQAMKVLSQEKKWYILTKKDFAKKDISNFISYKKATYVRELPPITLEDHKNIFEGHFGLLDSLLFEVGWKVNDDSYFIIEYEKDGQKNSIILPYDNGSLVLNRNLFTDSADEYKELQLSVKYIEKKSNDTTLITDRMFLDIFPISIE